MLLSIAIFLITLFVVIIGLFNIIYILFIVINDMNKNMKTNELVIRLLLWPSIFIYILKNRIRHPINKCYKIMLYNIGGIIIYFIIFRIYIEYLSTAQ